MYGVPSTLEASRSIETFEIFQSTDDCLFARLLYFPCKEELIHKSVHLVEVPHNIELAHIAKVEVQKLDTDD